MGIITYRKIEWKNLALFGIIYGLFLISQNWNYSLSFLSPIGKSIMGFIILVVGFYYYTSRSMTKKEMEKLK